MTEDAGFASPTPFHLFGAHGQHVKSINGRQPRMLCELEGAIWRPHTPGGNEEGRDSRGIKWKTPDPSADYQFRPPSHLEKSVLLLSINHYLSMSLRPAF
jgi:hypothetical protein